MPHAACHNLQATSHMLLQAACHYFWQYSVLWVAVVSEAILVRQNWRKDDEPAEEEIHETATKRKRKFNEATISDMTAGGNRRERMKETNKQKMYHSKHSHSNMKRHWFPTSFDLECSSAWGVVVYDYALNHPTNWGNTCTYSDRERERERERWENLTLSIWSFFSLMLTVTPFGQLHVPCLSSWR